MICVDFQGPAVVTGGIVEVEVNEGIVDLFFYLVFGGHLQPVLHTQIEEEEYFFILEILVVEHEGPHFETADPLQSIYD